MSKRKIGRILRKDKSWDYMFFYKLQLYKLEEMYNYFKQNKYTDNTIICRDIKICISLLKKFIYNDEPKYLNIRNYNRFNIEEYTKEALFKESDDFTYYNIKGESVTVKFCPKLFAVYDLYIEKILHLYHLILLYRSQTWSD